MTTEQHAMVLQSKDVDDMAIEELEVSVNADLQTLLLAAASNGDLDRFDKLIAKGANLYATDKFGKNALMLACRNGHFEVANKLIDLGVDVGLISTYGTNCFHYSAIGGHEKIVRKLLELGMDPNIKSYYGHSVTFYSVEYNHLHIFRILSAISTNKINDRNYAGRSMLMLACEKGFLELSQACLEVGASIDLRDNKAGDSALLLAGKGAHKEICKLLLQFGANVLDEDYAQYKFVFYVVRHGWMDMLDEILTSRGISINKFNPDRLIRIAGVNGHMELGRYLLCNKDAVFKWGLKDTLVDVIKGKQFEFIKMYFDIKPPTKSNHDLIALAAAVSITGNLEWTLYFVDLYGRNSEYMWKADNSRDSPLVNAASNGQTELALQMAEIVISINNKWLLQSINIAIFKAAVAGHYEVSSRLLDLQIPFETLYFKDIEYHHILHHTMKGKQTELSIKLINAGVKIDTVTCSVYEKSILIAAVEFELLDVVKVLIEKGVNLNAKDKVSSQSGDTALIYAARQGNLEILKELVKAGVDIHQQGKDRTTAMIAAIAAGKVNICAALIELGLNVNVPCELYSKCTYLMKAAAAGKVEICRLLLDHGADFSDCGRSFECPMEMAIKSGNIDTAMLIFERDTTERNNESKGQLSARIIDVAAACDRLDIILQLMKTYPIINVLNSVYKYTCSPVDIAAKNGHFDWIRNLVNEAHQIKPPQKPYKNSSITEYASQLVEESKFLEIIQWDIVSSKNNYATELLNCASKNYLHACMYLLTLNSAINTDAALLKAAEKGYTELAFYFIQHGANINAVDSSGMSVIGYAIATPNYRLYMKLLSCGVNLYHVVKYGDYSTKYEYQLVIYATKKEQYYFVSRILETVTKAIISEQISAYMQAFLYLAEARCSTIAFEMLSFGVYKEYFHHESKMTPLLFAAKYAQEELAIRMVNLGASVTYELKSGATALVFAIESNLEQLSLLLLRKGTKVNIPIVNGGTPLTLAMEHKMDAVVKAIMGKGVSKENLELKFHDNLNVLEIAIMNDYPDVARQILAYDPPINVSKPNIVLLAAKKGLSDIALKVMSLGCDVENLTSYYDDSASIFIVAAKYGATELAKVLKSMDKKGPDKKNMIALQYAAKNNNSELAIYLCDGLSSADRNRLDSDKLASLHHAAIHNDSELIEALMSTNAATIDIFGPNKTTALIYATKSGNCEAVSTLLKYKAKHELKDEHNMTAFDYAFESLNAINVINLMKVCQPNELPLQFAVNKNSLQLAKNLLKLESPNRVDINKAYASDNKTALHLSSKLKSTEIGLFLLSFSDLQVNLQDSQGMTALMHCGESGDIVLGKRLLDRGAKRLLKDKVDRTFINYALTSQASELIEYAVQTDIPCDNFGSENPQHEGFWFTFLDANGGIPSEIRLPILQRLLQQHTSIARNLALITDAFQRKAMDITDPECRKVFDQYLYFCGRYELYLDEAPIHVSETSIVVRGLDHGVLKDCLKVFRECAKLNASKLNLKEFMKCVNALGFFQHIADEAKRKEMMLEEFSKFDANDNQFIDETEFIQFVKAQLGGEARHIVMKFMMHKEQYDRENDIRMNYLVSSVDEDQQGSTSNCHYVMNILNAFDETHQEFQDGLALLGEVQSRKLNEYHFGIVMPRGDRSLQGIYMYERPDLNHIRTYLHDVAKGVQYLHDKGIAHLDLKPLNALRLSSNHICVIDMDAACSMSDIEALNEDDLEGNDIDYAGEKFSSGILPPEMFYKLKSVEEEKQYCEYWSHLPTHSMQWKKLAPIRTGKKGISTTFEKAGIYVVRSHHSHSTVAQSEKSLLPYDLLPATKSMDIWAYGCMLFQLLCGEPFVAVNRDDNLAGSEAMLKAATWTDKKVAARIDEFYDVHRSEDALDLLKKLLKVDPAERLSSMREIQAHRFFHPEENKSLDTEKLMKEVEKKLAANTQQMEEYQSAVVSKLDRIDDKLDRVLDMVVEVKTLSMKALHQIKKTEKVLLRGIFQQEDTKIPTCFIIVPEKLVYHDEKDEAVHLIEKVESAFTTASTKVSKASAWLSMLSGAAEQIKESLTASSSNEESGGGGLSLSIVDEYIQKSFSSVKSTKLYFYLIDEYTMQPIVPQSDDGIYPINITVQSDFIKQMLPMLRVSYKAFVMVNGLSGIARMFGYPTPHIPPEMLDKVSSFIGQLDQQSSVAEFATLQDCVSSVTTIGITSQRKATRKSIVLKVGGGMGGPLGKSLTTEEKAQKVYGSAIRELERFLSSHDEKRNYCGLTRVSTPEGYAIWTTDEHRKKVELEGKQEEEAEEKQLTLFLQHPEQSLVIPKQQKDHQQQVTITNDENKNIVNKKEKIEITAASSHLPMNAVTRKEVNDPLSFQEGETDEPVDLIDNPMHQNKRMNSKKHHDGENDGVSVEMKTMSSKKNSLSNKINEKSQEGTEGVLQNEISKLKKEYESATREINRLQRELQIAIENQKKGCCTVS